MLTTQDWKETILLEVGAGLDSTNPVEAAALDKVTPLIDKFWAMYISKAMIYPMLNVLYTKRHCLNVLYGQFRDLIRAQIGGFTVSQEQKLANIKTMIDQVNEEIKEVETKASASRPPALGYMVQTSPQMPRPQQPNANDPRYRGDALARPRPRDIGFTP